MPLLAGAKAIHKYIFILVWKRVAGEPVASNGLSFELETRTPLWAGGVGTSCDRLHETGILGSLRWWYEALVRGLGGYACNPSNHECEYGKGICDACAVFGATGWKRLFRLEMEDVSNENKDKQLIVKVHNNGRDDSKWYLRRGIHHKCTITLKPIRNVKWDEDADYLHSILLALMMASRWGGLGAKTQMGYGVVDVKVNDESLEVEKALRSIEKLKQRKDRKKVNTAQLPDFQEFFFGKFRIKGKVKDVNELKNWISNVIYQVPKNPHKKESKDEYEKRVEAEIKSYFDQGVLPISPVVRYHLRRLFRDNFTGERVRHEMMGYLKKDRRFASRIKVSHAYKVDNGYEFRIWGWVPEKVAGTKRDEIMEKLAHWMCKPESSSDGKHKGELLEKIGKDVKCLQWIDMKSKPLNEHTLKELIEG